MIDIINIYKSFNGLNVLTGVNLKIDRGDSLVIFGPSGCGKSVLLKLILALIKPEEGRIEFEGRNIYDISNAELDSIRTRFGMLFQGAALFDSMTVAENVTLAMSEHTNASKAQKMVCARKNLEMVGLDGIEDKYPAELSGGMKKRVGLARALCMQPEVILYDEPTTGLDPVSADKINDLIISLRDRLTMTTITVTHDIYSAFRIGNRFAMLFDGVIRFDGSREELEGSNDPVIKDFLSHR